MNIAIGLAALFSLVTGANNIAIGDTAGARLVRGSCNIIIGPSENQLGDGDNVILIDGISYPPSTRTKAWFQTLVRQRAHSIVEGMRGTHKMNFEEAHATINSMSFNESACTVGEVVS